MTEIEPASCRTARDHFVPALVGTLGPAGRFDLEAHLARCADCAATLRALDAAGTAYERAFAELRLQRTSLAPGRARLAAGGLARSEPIAGDHRWPRLMRLSEMSLALGVMAFVIMGSLEGGSTAVVEPELDAPAQTNAVLPTAAAASDEDLFQSLRVRMKVATTTLSGSGARVPPAGGFE